MGYHLHIERRSMETDESQPIPIAEWVAAVEAAKDVRVFTGAKHSFTNPKTGEVTSWRARPGDVEVRFGAEWRFVFSWFGGSATFKAQGAAIGDASDPAWAAAVELAKRLGAVICGDEGECSDLYTGKPLPPPR